MRARIPMKYVVFSRDRLYDILTMNLSISTIDKMKFAVMSELLYEGCTISDILLIFEKYAIDYHARRAMIAIKRSVNEKCEIPDEIAFVTCRTGEEPRSWDNYGRND